MEGSDYENIFGAYSSDESSKSYQERSHGVRTSYQKHYINVDKSLWEVAIEQFFPERTEKNVILGDKGIDKESPS